jgi:hypothetical protein
MCACASKFNPQPNENSVSFQDGIKRGSKTSQMKPRQNEQEKEKNSTKDHENR